jgi:hypothetical protein
VYFSSQVWKIQTSGPIFSSLLPFEFSQQSSTSSGEKVLLFGCHDNHFYCLNQLNGNLKWKINLGSTIFSSPSACKTLFFLFLCSSVKFKRQECFIASFFFTQRKSLICSVHPRDFKEQSSLCDLSLCIQR